MSTDQTDLEPIEPSTAQELYLDHKASEYAEETVQAHRYRTNHFVEWCGIEDIDNLNDLTGRSIQRYRLWRQETGDLAKITLNQQMSTIRVFLKWAGSIEAVPANLYDKVMVPRVTPEQERRDETLSSDAASDILDHLSTFHYASLDHALFALLWETGMRIGAAQSLDVEDYNPEEQYVELRHRPDSGTRLKNKDEGERFVALSQSVCDALDAYLKFSRDKVADEYGRSPLFTSSQGRPAKSTLRDSTYRITRPCQYTGECPHDCEIDSCEAMETNKASRCPSSVSPHAIRRGAITKHLSNDVPDKVVSDRMNVSLDVLEKHYDRRSQHEKAEQRRGYMVSTFQNLLACR